MNPIAYDTAREEGDDTETGTNVHALPGAETGPTEPTGPTGPDFTKPLRTVNTRLPVRVITVSAAGSAFPIVALVKSGGIERPVSLNTMGEDPELEIVVENVPPIPSTAIGRVLRSTADDGLCFDSRVFSTERDATEGVPEGFEFISTYRVLLPQINDRGEAEEIEEAPSDLIEEIKIGNRTFTVGQVIQAKRRGYGYRDVKILKFRDVPGKSHMKAFVEPIDGSGPYWALNTSIR